MKQALIFLHGNLSDVSHVREYLSDSLIICADGGVEYVASLGITPHVVIGDFDSLSPDDLDDLKKNNVEIHRYPREKDLTDGELAVQYAIDHHCDEIIVTGLLGDRVDHLSANLMCLAMTSKNHTIRIIEHDQTIYFVEKAVEIVGEKGDEVSLIPFQTDCNGVTTSGLEYGLNHAALPFGSTRGISNVMLGKSAAISLSEGVLMVVHRSK